MTASLDSRTTQKDSASSTFDVVIVGTGITATLVYKFLKNSGLLRKHNLKIAFLECGLAAKKEAWSEEVTHRFADGKLFSRNDPLINPLYSQPKAQMEHAFGSFRFDYNMKMGLGGSGTRWGGNVFRFFPDDFQDADGNDVFPFSYEELTPFYSQMESQLQVSGSAADPLFPWPDMTFVHPPFKQTYSDSVLSRCLGGDYAFFPKPLAAKRSGDNACRGNRVCTRSCPRGALVSSFSLGLDEALEDPSCSFFFRHQASRLQFSSTSGRITAVVCRSLGKTHTFKAKVFFLCANAVENVRILLLSSRQAQAKHQTFLPNSSPLVGAYWGSHLNVDGFITCAQELFNGRGKVMNTFGVHRKRAAITRTGINNFLLELFNVPHFGFPAGYAASDCLENIDLGIKTCFPNDWGNTLIKKLRKLNFTCYVNFVSACSLTAAPAFTLSEQHDANGIPLIKMIAFPTQKDVKTLDYLQDQVMSFARAEGVMGAGIHGFGLNGNHPLGGHRMAHSARHGIVNQGLQCFDHSNLFLLGGGNFCSTSCVNPTLTIAAMTARGLSISAATLDRLLA